MPAIWCCLSPFFSHISSDAALVVMPPLGALMFLAVGRHPVAGLLAAIAGVGCGFTANLLIVTTDVLLSGISTEAAKSIDASLHVSVIDNWYFYGDLGDRSDARRRTDHR
ncbi:Aminobenzoyl-glutamate transport protein [Klebsiella pneumoniae ISC21]|nr:Aminobenzoyl-glutamate transport protein [Klebsiella pneumoniae ISC21]